MKNIEINIKQTDGTYEVLYPKTNVISSSISAEVNQQFHLEDGSINDVLQYLGKFNEYWWSEENNSESEEWELLYSDFPDCTIYWPDATYYSKKINIANDGSISLSSEQSTYSLTTFKSNLPCYVKIKAKYDGSNYTYRIFFVTEETSVGFYQDTYGDDNDPYVIYKRVTPLIQYVQAHKKILPKAVIWKTNVNSEAYSKNMYNITYHPQKTNISSATYSYGEYYGYTNSYTFSEYGKVIPGEITGHFSPSNNNDYIDEIRGILPGKYVFRLVSFDDLRWDGSSFEYFDGTSFSISNSKSNNKWIVSGNIDRIASTTTNSVKSGNLNLYWSSPYLNLKQMTHSYIGSYIGTGTYGYDSPTVLEFDFVPKLIICNRLYWESNGWKNSFIWTINNGISTRASAGNGSVIIIHNGIKIAFISTDDATAQYNTLNTTYDYVAFG